MVYLVGVFCGTDDQKYFLLVYWGLLILGVLTKNNFFLHIMAMANILRIQEKISKNMIF